MAVGYLKLRQFIRVFFCLRRRIRRLPVLILCLAAGVPRSIIFFDEKTGARCIDRSKCIGCGACAKACPLASAKFPPIRRVVKDGKKIMIK